MTLALTNIFCSSHKCLHFLSLPQLNGQPEVSNLDIQRALPIEENILRLREERVGGENKSATKYLTSLFCLSACVPPSLHPTLDLNDS